MGLAGSVYKVQRVWVAAGSTQLDMGWYKKGVRPIFLHFYKSTLSLLSFFSVLSLKFINSRTLEFSGDGDGGWGWRRGGRPP